QKTEPQATTAPTPHLPPTETAPPLPDAPTLLSEKNPAFGEPQENQPSTAWESPGDHPSTTAPQRDGISSASPFGRMVSHTETEKLAQSGLQKVPAVPASRENPVSTFSGSHGQEAASHAAHAAPPPSQSLPTPEVHGSGGHLAPAAQPARLARIATEIQDMAVELLHFKADSMSVLIRPDAETAMQLRMTIIAGRIYAEARLHSGDAAWLQSAWSDLQRVLSEHNIIMEPLKYSSFHPAAEQNSDGRQPRQEHQPPPHDASGHTPALTPLPANLPPRKRRAIAGWEWWA
ncbi:MAG: hypothetical protein N3J91_03370, partial [Verrucomicrobiae bacterium]|nr:hypothetical protein [Verrucomicrobiae bacterium]